MDLKLIILAVFGIVIAVCGILQWAKSPFPKVPTWVWWILSPVLCFVLALTAVVGLPLGVPLLGFLIIGALAWAISQFSYDIIVQHVPRIVGAWADKLETDAGQRMKWANLDTPAQLTPTLGPAPAVASPPSPT